MKGKTIQWTEIELSIHKDNLEIKPSRINDEYERVFIRVPSHSSGASEQLQAVRMFLEGEGVSREVSGKASGAFLDVLYKETAMEALKDMIVVDKGE